MFVTVAELAKKSAGRPAGDAEDALNAEARGAAVEGGAGRAADAGGTAVDAPPPADEAVAPACC